MSPFLLEEYFLITQLKGLSEIRFSQSEIKELPDSLCSF
jgi:hypothetical protein